MAFEQANHRRVARAGATGGCTPNSPILACGVPDAEQINERLLRAYSQLGEQDFDRRSHFIGGRFENLYISPDKLPGVEAVLRCAQRHAQELLGLAPQPLRCGFWLNVTNPGQATSLHTHDENDELLSGVYYVATPANAGDICFQDGPFSVRVAPRAGLMLLFPPELPHSVARHAGRGLRLSIGFNLGPGDALAPAPTTQVA